MFYFSYKVSTVACNKTRTFLNHARRSIRKLANQLCKPIDIRLVFTCFKNKNLFKVKDAVAEGLRTRVVYKFSCVSRNASGAPNDVFLLNALKTLFGLSRVLLDL